MALMTSGAMLAATGCSNQFAPANSASTTAPDPKETTKRLLAADSQLATSVDVSEKSDRTQLTLPGIVPTEQLRSEAVNMAKTGRKTQRSCDRPH
jgi:hypothetical protein